MSSLFANWKTSAMGLGMLLSTGLSTVLPVLPPQYAVIANGVLGALGLFLAQDGKAK
jgi:hypothetical protein